MAGYLQGAPETSLSMSHTTNWTQEGHTACTSVIQDSDELPGHLFADHVHHCHVMMPTGSMRIGMSG